MSSITWIVHTLHILSLSYWKWGTWLSEQPRAPEQIFGVLAEEVPAFQPQPVQPIAHCEGRKCLESFYASNEKLQVSYGLQPPLSTSFEAIVLFLHNFHVYLVTHRDNFFLIYHIITSHALNIYNFICQLCVNKKIKHLVVVAIAVKKWPQTL